MTSPQPIQEPVRISTFPDGTRHTSPVEANDVLSSDAARETQTAYQPSTGTDPSGRMEYKQRLKEVKREMDGHWVEGDSSLLDSFFPPGSVSQDDIKHVKREMYDSTRKRWRGIPKKLSCEKLLVQAIMKILHTICRHGNIDSDHDILDTQKARISTHDGGTLAPDMYIAVLHGLISPAEVHEAKPTTFEQCLAFIEAKLHRHRHPAEDAVQVATYSREILMAQSNRNFVPCFSMTEQMMQFAMFDRSGAVRSSYLDYHKHPDRACEIMISLLRCHPHSLGFDHTVFYKTPSMQCIKTRERSGTGEYADVTYVVEALLMRSYTIIGSGTTYWRVRKELEGDSKSSEQYIIQDSWPTLDMEDEQALIRDVGNDYVAPLVHKEVVRSHEGRPDTTVCNRLTAHAARETVDRIHTRSIYKSSGRLLEQFENPMEVLVSFHHAIKAHGLLLEQGVIYPDIVPWNLLIPSKRHSGDCSALIDLDQARRSGSSSFREQRTPGSWFFQTRAVLEGSTTTSHMDHLESFFYIFCFIVVAHTGPLLASSRIENSGELAAYGSMLGIALSEKKCLFGLETFKYTVQTQYFKQPTAQLAVDLHSFFHSRWEKERDADMAGEVLPLPDPVEDYREFIAHFDKAIEDLAILCGNFHPIAQAKTALPLLGTGSPSKVEEIAGSEQVETQESRKRTLSTALGDKVSYNLREHKRPRPSYNICRI